MKKVMFKITDCCGDELSEVMLRIPDSEDATSIKHRERAIARAGFKQHICGGCLDNAFDARPVEK